MQTHDLVHTEALQPFLKLAQANTELLLRYAWSPEVIAEMTRSAQAIVEQNQASFARLMGSQAFVGLMQGLMANYVEFLGDVTRSAHAVMSHTQAAAAQQSTRTLRLVA